jgi:hypothetical protein
VGVKADGFVAEPNVRSPRLGGAGGSMLAVASTFAALFRASDGLPPHVTPQSLSPIHDRGARRSAPDRAEVANARLFGDGMFESNGSVT